MTITTNLAASRLEERLDRAIEDLQAARRLLRAAVGRMDDAEPGYPGGGDGGGSGDDSGPLRSTVVLRDDALRDRAKLDADLARIEQQARNVLGLTQRWGIRRVGESDREPDDLWCRSCLRAGHMAPRREGNHGPNCRWCQDTLRAVNVVRTEWAKPAWPELPIVAVRHHATGKRTTARDIEGWARDRARR